MGKQTAGSVGNIYLRRTTKSKRLVWQASGLSDQQANQLVALQGGKINIKVLSDGNMFASFPSYSRLAIALIYFTLNHRHD